MKKINLKKVLLVLTIIAAVAATIFLVAKTRTTPLPPPVAFEFVKVLPPEGENEIAFPTTAIIFYFNKMLDISKTSVTISPDHDIEASLGEDGKSLIVKTIYPWGFGIKYIISLKVISSTGDIFEKPDFNFTFKKPTNSPMTD